MQDIKNSHLLEDECMSKLKWSIQRVANATSQEMHDALQIYKNMPSSNNTVSKLPSKPQSVMSTPVYKNHKPSHVSIPNTTTDTTITYDFNSNIDNIDTLELKLERRKERMKQIQLLTRSIHTTKMDQDFLMNELQYEEDAKNKLQYHIKQYHQQRLHFLL